MGLIEGRVGDVSRRAGKSLASNLRKKVHAVLVCHGEAFFRCKMKRVSGVDPMPQRLRQISTILGMLDQLDRVGRLIDAEIGEIGLTEPPLPIHTSLTQRRVNLEETVGTLKARLAYLRNGANLPA
jgi:hypothetical protein